MKDKILQTLAALEREEDIRILHAVESGSRAWGFPSLDSDYDVRFIYVRRPAYYLKLEKTRDVIELPIHDMLDINGWDLNKTLRLLHGSNPTLFEWMSSPVVYQKTQFMDQFKPLMDVCYSARSGLYHYLSMAEGNYREYLKGETVRAKKYLYVLRPVLACKWILQYRSAPPMLFSQLMESVLEENMLPAVNRLIDLKMHAPEVKEIPRLEEINCYLDWSIDEVRSAIAALPEEQKPSWEPLDKLFLQVLAEWENETK